MALFSATAFMHDYNITASNKLYEQLDVRNVDCEILFNDSGEDPVKTSKDEIDALKKELGIAILK